MFFTDLHVQLLARGILEPGEQLLGQTATSYMPWWAFGFIRRQYLVLATDRRLVLLDHRYGFLMPTVQRLHAVESIPWSNVQDVQVKGLLKKKLRVRGASERGPISLTMKIPNTFFGLLAPMKDNVAGARNVAAAFPAARANPPAMPYAPPAPQLAAPGHSGYGIAPSHHPAPVPAQPPQAQAPASIPPVNAPGYASVPPPGPNHYGVQPSAAPNAPPQSWDPSRTWS